MFLIVALIMGVVGGLLAAGEQGSGMPDVLQHA